MKNSIVFLLISLFALFIGCEEDAAESGEIYKVYITLQNVDKVAVMDGETGEIIREVDTDMIPNVADNPHYVIIDEVNKVWYVTLISSGYVLKFDLLTDELLDSVFVGNQPALMEIDPMGDYIYVSRFMPMMGMSNASTQVHRINTSTLTVDSVDVGASSPHGIAISSDGSELWVASNQASHFFRIETDRFGEEGYEPESYKIGSEVPDPVGINDGIYEVLEIVISPDGEKLFMSCSDMAKNEIRVFSTSSGDSLATYSLESMGMQPWHLTTDPDGEYLYVASRMANAVSIVDLETGSIYYIENTLFDTPHGVAISQDGSRLYMTSSAMMGGGQSYLHIIDTATNSVIENVQLGEGTAATGLAVMQGSCNNCD
ncbi:MAG: YncE family protein [Candidatus Marinimicrobia bacterium]|nr:YncE family protein [Candidatus Neomarinimicrobiota bacterium]MDP6569427.1 YncE family protein [Candidatus Neomarinimicrobiota bacterium]MDP7025552.1 YncE family protein [Candidatus Neomarinimicrobiota bacterium]